MYPKIVADCNRIRNEYLIELNEYGVKSGKKRKYDQHQIQEIKKKREAGEGYGTIARSLGISRATIQTIIKRELTNSAIFDIGVAHC